MDKFDLDFSEFVRLMKETTANLEKMNAAQSHMRWQFGDPEFYEKFVTEMNNASYGWMHSHC